MLRAKPTHALPARRPDPALGSLPKKKPCAKNGRWGDFCTGHPGGGCGEGLSEEELWPMQAVGQTAAGNVVLVVLGGHEGVSGRLRLAEGLLQQNWAFHEVVRVPCKDVLRGSPLRWQKLFPGA